MTIAVGAAKGGPGKTTLVAALAVAAALGARGLRVAVGDLDPQGSLTRWWNARAFDQPFLANLVGRPIAELQRELHEGGFDLLILDCPPGFSTYLLEAISASDLVLIPTGASALDLEAVASTADMAERAGVPFRFVLNRAGFRTRLAGQAVRELRERGGMLWPPVHLRVAVAAAMKSGRTALETEPGGAAARELTALWEAVWSCLLDIGGRRAARRTAARHRA